MAHYYVSCSIHGKVDRKNYPSNNQGKAAANKAANTHKWECPRGLVKVLHSELKVSANGNNYYKYTRFPIDNLE